MARAYVHVENAVLLELVVEFQQLLDMPGAQAVIDCCMFV